MKVKVSSKDALSISDEKNILWREKLRRLKDITA